MSKKSKSEWQDHAQSSEARTDAEVDKSKEYSDDAERTTLKFGDQPSPSLSDTAEQLNLIAGELRQDIEREQKRHAGQVADSVGEQREQISQPLSELAEAEGNAASELERASSKSDGHADRLSEVARERREAEEFAAELAKSDSEHQSDAESAAERYDKAVDEAVRAMKDF
jgi:uncharacterized protein (DUF3084 family)